MFHFHKFSRWIDVERGKVMHGREMIGFYVKQERRCLKCNLAEERIATSVRFDPIFHCLHAEITEGDHVTTRA